jgi:hypothetical protein
MGVGDSLMCTALARRAQETDPRKVRVVGADKVVRWDDVWLHNPRFAQPGEVGDFQDLPYGPGLRPYIAGKSDVRWKWRAHKCEPGEIYFTPAELAFARAWDTGRVRVLIEPHLKPRASPNKRWYRQNWQTLVASRPDIEWVQFGPRGTDVLTGVRFFETPTFRQACAMLQLCDAAVLIEGGLHHAAAAVNTPAVVIYGGFISPGQTGYDMHRNLVAGQYNGPCGMRVPCDHCARAMGEITPAMVLTELDKIL